MKIKSSSYMLIAILILTLIIIVNSYTMARMKVKLVPMAVGGLVFILSAIELVKELVKANRVKQTSVSEISTTAKAKKEEVLKFVIAFLWLAGFTLAIYVVGFLAGIPIYIFTFLKTHGQSWFKSILISIISACVVYLVFVLLLKVNLFPGILFGGNF